MIWYLYFVVSVFHLFSIYTEHAEGITWSKPLLMSVLLLIIYTQTRLKSKLSLYLFIGVFLGWLGDVFLMGKGVHYFAAGLVSFLLGHLIYVYIFSKEVSLQRKTHFLMEKPYLMLPFLGFWIFSISLLSGKIINIPPFPVYLYAFVILLMCLMAINRWYAVSRRSWLIVFVGSLLFIVSDFSLSIKFFIGNYPYSSLLIMSTYISAQGMIVYGCLKSEGLRDR